MADKKVEEWKFVSFPRACDLHPKQRYIKKIIYQDPNYLPYQFPEPFPIILSSTKNVPTIRGFPDKTERCVPALLDLGEGNGIIKQ